MRKRWKAPTPSAFAERYARLATRLGLPHRGGHASAAWPTTNASTTAWRMTARLRAGAGRKRQHEDALDALDAAKAEERKTP
jgi:hypothetical protein